ncbi:MAG: hypothetical protein JXQ23_03835 [Clostridia bacterium]|nr:hypothetical protein [Clostridia bacterium]
MNTKKALNIVIILLLIINVFMFVFLLYLNSSYSDRQNEIKYVKEILEYRGIVNEVTLDNNANDKKPVIFGKGIFTDEFITQVKEVTGGTVLSSKENTVLSYYQDSSLKEADYISDRIDADKRVRLFLDSIGFNHINYIVDNVTMSSRNTFNIKYIYSSKEETMYDLYINAVVNEYGISNIVIRYIENEFTEGKSFKILPMTNVIMSNVVYREENSKGAGANIIKRIDSGYKLDKNNVPQYVWRITYGDDTISYFNAQNGHEIN